MSERPRDDGTLGCFLTVVKSDGGMNRRPRKSDQRESAMQAYQDAYALSSGYQSLCPGPLPAAGSEVCRAMAWSIKRCLERMQLSLREGLESARSLGPA